MTETLLDKFAMAALTGLTARNQWGGIEAAKEYDAADAMLAEKQKRCQHDFNRTVYQHDYPPTCSFCGAVNPDNPKESQ